MESTITCPYCGFKKTEKIPENMCQYFYECVQCSELLKSQGTDCCVFCSYGDKKCPSSQN